LNLRKTTGEKESGVGKSKAVLKGGIGAVVIKLGSLLGELSSHYLKGKTLEETGPLTIHFRDRA